MKSEAKRNGAAFNRDNIWGNDGLKSIQGLLGLKSAFERAANQGSRLDPEGYDRFCPGPS